MEKIDKFINRNYTVRETGAIYFTNDMDKTAQWFENVLGWFYQIDERNEKHQGLYGCTYPFPSEIERMRITPFTGIHLFVGPPKQELVAFIRVSGIESLYAFVRNNGWNQITPVEVQPWGAKLCSITTVDGSVINFFE